MHLYLSSYKLGDNPERLAAMIGSNKKAAIIPNALDAFMNIERRKESIQNNIDELKGIGLEPEELDLKKFFGKTDELRNEIKKYGLLWVRGGNTFVLGRAMKESGFDTILHELKDQDNIVYGGYSAGICVLAPSLRGIHLMDTPEDVQKTYNKEIIWEGVGILSYSIVPHYQSDHLETELADICVKYLKENNLPFKTLRDGEVIIEKI